MDYGWANSQRRLYVWRLDETIPNGFDLDDLMAQTIQDVMAQPQPFTLLVDARTVKYLSSDLPQSIQGIARVMPRNIKTMIYITDNRDFVAAYQAIRDRYPDVVGTGTVDFVETVDAAYELLANRDLNDTSDKTNRHRASV